MPEGAEPARKAAPQREPNLNSHPSVDSREPAPVREEPRALAPTPDARPAALRILDAVRRLKIEAPGGRAIGLTVSIGAAGQAGGAALDELVIEADEQLYRAKAQGRNRAVFALDIAAVA